MDISQKFTHIFIACLLYANIFNNIINTNDDHDDDDQYNNDVDNDNYDTNSNKKIQ